MAGNESNELSSTRVPPSVSKDKSVQLAIKKLERGWIIVLGDKGKNANFFKPGKGFDPLLLAVAKKLIGLGLIVEDGRHPLGTKYVLEKDADTSVVASLASRETDDEDDVDSEDSSEYDDVDGIDEDDADSISGDEESEAQADSSRVHH